jgi:hypothetical protein
MIKVENFEWFFEKISVVIARFEKRKLIETVITCHCCTEYFFDNFFVPDTRNLTVHRPAINAGNARKDALICALADVFAKVVFEKNGSNPLF